MYRRSLRNVPHDVYRIYDASENLLYVGASVNAFRRVYQHKRDHQPWWPDAHHFSVIRYADKNTGRYFEAVAIWAEGPLWNISRERMVLDYPRQIQPEPLGELEWFYI